jgi:glyoxylase-like metal-dependent hydrolase (beta-lactamase superfamily II)
LATPFLQHLGEAGWSRDGVDAVVCTHLHVDHVGWNTMFENGKWALVEQDHVISPEIRLMPSTGHTPGHVSVMIESEGERAVITGDMTHHPCQLAHPRLVARRQRPEGRRAHPLAPLRPMGRADDPRHRHAPRRPHRRPHRARRRSVQVCGVSAASTVNEPERS